MARPYRGWYPGQILHVMNRGGCHQEIFRDESDYRYWLYLMKELLKEFDCVMHAYCLMTNHYHFLLETKNDNVALFMKQISQTYTRHFNDKYGRDGALFRGRYKSCEIKTDAYFLQTSRYISLNPVKAKIVNEPQKYEWSSYLTMIGKQFDGLTHRKRTLSYFQDNDPELYRQFVEDWSDYEKYEESICQAMGDT